MTCWEPLLATDWAEPLEREFDKRYWIRLHEFLEEEWRRQRAYPPRKDVFAALTLTWLRDTKVVILGQDPYPGFGQAHGLAFSVRFGVPKPRTLRKIHDELHDDLGAPIPNHGNLEEWARGGVLLLNTALTVGGGTARSHRGMGWETFTDRVIEAVNGKLDRVVFMLWGKEAKEKCALIDTSRHTIICSSHPSPQAAHRGLRPFIRSKPFSRANQALDAAGVERVAWPLA